MYDIVIVGAGVCGCSIARELSKKQANILVVEKEDGTLINLQSGEVSLSSGKFI